ncbi:MAG: hypothetical protein WBM50_09185, partial [Acidimicrobiales bacterium]
MADRKTIEVDRQRLLPLATGSIGGGQTDEVHVRLPLGEVPLALAELHRVLAPDATAFVTLF